MFKNRLADWNLLRPRHKGAILLVVLVIVGLLAMLSAPALSSASRVSQPALPQEQAVSSGQITDEPGFVWTPEEMQKAQPADMQILPGAPPALDQPTLPSGPEVTFPGQLPTDAPTPKGNSGFAPLQDMMSPDAYTYWPAMTVGKVFFRDGGYSYVCSGSSAVNRAIWTAGHCVYNNVSHQWSTNFVFVPAYDTGSMPYGSWSGPELWTLTAWVNGDGNSFAYDIGMAVMTNHNGRTLSQTVGNLGMLANGSRTQTVIDLGYPAVTPYNGNSMFGCYSQYRGTDPVFNPATNWLDCDQTGGTSGGPWVIDFRSGGLLLQNGVNSYRYTSSPRRLYSPYFGTGAINLYNAVRYR